MGTTRPIALPAAAVTHVDPLDVDGPFHQIDLGSMEVCLPSDRAAASNLDSFNSSDLGYEITTKRDYFSI